MLRPIIIVLILAIVFGGGIRIFQHIPAYDRARVGRQIMYWVLCLIAAIVAVLFVKAMF